MSNNTFKEKFTHDLGENHVDAKEPVKTTSVSDDDPFRYYEPPIPAEELQAKVDKLLAERANGKEIEPAENYNDPEVLKKYFTIPFITDEERKERDAKIASGEIIVISHDDPRRPYYPPVTLEESKESLRRLIEEMRKEG